MINIAYLQRVRTSRKSGKNTIYRRSLKAVLEEQSQKNPVSEETLNDEQKTRELKENEPGIFPISLTTEQPQYTNALFNRKTVNGSVIFLDIDSVALAERLFEDADVLQSLFPPLLAGWYSLRGKIHIAVRCDWIGFSGYAAAWIGISDKLSEIISGLYGKTISKMFSTANDGCMIIPSHCVSACYTKGYRWFGDGISFAGENVFIPDQKLVSQNIWREEQKVIVVKDTLFTDDEAKRRWRRGTVNSWVKWANENRKWEYTTENKQLEYNKSIYIEPGVSKNMEHETIRYCENDGDYYTIKFERKGYSSRKLLDGRKRWLNAVAKFAASVLSVSFEECLYITSVFYIRNCEPWYACEVEDPESFIQLKVEDAYANRVRNMNTLNGLRDTREIIVDPCDYSYEDESSYYCGQICYHSGREQSSMARAVKAQLRVNKLRECYTDGDTLVSLTEKMSCWYSSITETTVYRIAKIAGVKVNSTKKYKSKYSERYGNRYAGRYDYVNAYDTNGKRTRVKKELVDNQKYFDSKKKYNAYVESLDAG